MAEDIKCLNKGVNIDDRNVSILLYADDIVLISENEENLQYMLDFMCEWCYKWKLRLNIDKSSVVLFRPKPHNRSDFRFHFGENQLITVDKYKYLGIFLDEQLSFEYCASVLSDSASRALGYA